jgi:hypothetical protein
MATDPFFAAILAGFALASWGLVVVCDRLTEGNR